MSPNRKTESRGRPTAAVLRRLPKVDLHCHLDGSVRVGTVLELAKARKVRLPASTAAELKKHVQVSPTCRSLKEFLDIFELLYPLLRDAEAVERISYELAEDCAADGIRHVEVRFAPLLQAHRSFNPDAVVGAALKGLERGYADFGVTSGVIVCLFRGHSPADNRKAFKAMKVRYGRGVVGLDVAGDEARFPTREFSDFFEEANRLKIPTTCHAGETEGTENLRAALDLDVRRIGHGIHLLEDDRLVQEVVRRRIPLEIGITSNVRTRSVASRSEHPVVRFHRLGVPITLNTDDRGILGIDLTHEYREAAALGMTPADLARVALNGVDAAFLAPAKKRKMRIEFEREVRCLLGEPHEAEKA